MYIPVSIVTLQCIVNICRISVCFFPQNLDMMKPILKGDSIVKKWFKKAGLIAAGVVALTSVVSAVPVSADASRVVYFTIQNDVVCIDAKYYTGLFFNVTNVSSSSANITIQLYDNNGNEIAPSGQAFNGYTSTITPGSNFALNGKNTKQYTALFGQEWPNPCTARPAFGKITVTSDTGLIMASGEITGQGNRSDGQFTVFHDIPIVVNNGQPF